LFDLRKFFFVCEFKDLDFYAFFGSVSLDVFVRLDG